MINEFDTISKAYDFFINLPIIVPNTPKTPLYVYYF